MTNWSTDGTRTNGYKLVLNGFKMRAVLVQLFSKKYRKRVYLV